MLPALSAACSELRTYPGANYSIYYPLLMFWACPLGLQEGGGLLVRAVLVVGFCEIDPTAYDTSQTG